jgi:signal transduction histidine kinase
MKLARKITLPLVLCAFTVLGADTFLRVQREMALFESEMARDHHLLGRALGAAVAEALERSGLEKAQALVRAANEEGSGVGIRWVWLDVPEGHPDAPRLPSPQRAELEAGREVSWLDKAEPGSLRTYLPLSGPRPAALELSEGLAAEHAYVRDTLVSTVLASGAIALGGGLLAVLLGIFIVGRPLQRLAEQARRIGAGDLSVRLPEGARDEIGALGREMNHMCEQLEEARAKLAEETRARLAALEQLRQADRLSTVGQLASGIAHELGTPLNVISARARQIASGTAVGDKLTRAAHVIEAQSEHMTRIIRQLLDFARPRASRRTRQDLVSLTRDTLEALTPLASQRQVALELLAHEPLQASVDPHQIRQVLMNLVMNAIQASPRGERVTVSISVEELAPPLVPGVAPGSYARILVEDHGTGITPEVRARLFEPFFTTKDVGEGTGLGLSVAYGLAQEHGGWIAVESPPEGGSRFSLYLPWSEHLPAPLSPVPPVDRFTPSPPLGGSP